MNAETSTGVSTICVYTRPSRPLDVIYPLLPASLCLPLLFFPRVNLSGLLPRFLFPSSAPFLVRLHVRADYALSSRNYFAYMPSPFTLSTAAIPLHPPPTASLFLSLSRCYHPAFYKIYVCRRAGDVAAGYLFFQ